MSLHCYNLGLNINKNEPQNTKIWLKFDFKKQPQIENLWLIFDTKNFKSQQIFYYLFIQNKLLFSTEKLLPLFNYFPVTKF
ncbi:MAG: hypothetical protein A2068_13095 [Ignavibacteria bacterium GWB2_35_6b]|nr:MAG: hypothetical protein A2068_13095 [Ignavibacteria bacterium GWB2_35_6b]